MSQKFAPETQAPVPPVTIVPPPLAPVEAVDGWLKVGTSVTTFCWFTGPVPSPPTEMSNTRFCQITLLYSNGYEKLRQFALFAFVPWKCPVGHTTVAGRFANNCELFCIATMPAG